MNLDIALISVFGPLALPLALLLELYSLYCLLHRHTLLGALARAPSSRHLRHRHTLLRTLPSCVLSVAFLMSDRARR